MLLALTAAVANLVCPRSVLAADAPSSPPATVVPQDRDDRDLQRDLRGVPDNVKDLILTFDQTRDKFLQQQNLLKIDISNLIPDLIEVHDRMHSLLQTSLVAFLEAGVPRAA